MGPRLLARALQVWALVLCAFCSDTLALWVLETPPFNCSQEGLSCRVINTGNCLTISWFRPYTYTPSAPRSIEVNHTVSRDENGRLVPTLEIKWEVATDASILSLQGAQLDVLQQNNNQHHCIEFQFGNNFSNQRRPDGERWQFAFSRFVVDPGNTYIVTVHHLPKLDSNEDQNLRSINYTVPDCFVLDDPVMKSTWACERMGSQWEPRTAVEVRPLSNLEISFCISNLSSKYHIYVTSSNPEMQQECRKATQNVTEVGTHQRVNVSIALNDDRRGCCQYKVEGYLKDLPGAGLPFHSHPRFGPKASKDSRRRKHAQVVGFFPDCANDCRRHVAWVSCPTSPPSPTTPAGPMRRDHWYITASCALLVSLATAAIIFLLITPEPKPHRDPPDHGTHLSKIQKVWIVYSADHELYVDVVLKLADFLRAKCGADVVLDLLQMREIEKVGILPWLTSQKQEIEKQSGKIIILCSRGAQAKWQAMMDKPRVSLQHDRSQPCGDLFTAALNLIMHDFQLPANFGKYIIAYIGDISTEEDIPEPFKATSRYRLMETFEDVFFRIHDLEKYEPRRVITVEEITAQDYTLNPSGQFLRAAICKFKSFQEVHPDWFLQACTAETFSYYSEQDGLDLDNSLDHLKNGVTLKLHPVYTFPKDNECLFAEVQVREPKEALARIEPLLPCQEEYGKPALQTAIYIPEGEMDALVQLQEPVYSVEYEKAATQQAPYQTAWFEGASLPHASSALRNELLLNDLGPLSFGQNQRNDNQSLPEDEVLSNEQKRNLEELRLFQQSLALSGQLCLEEEQQHLLQNDLHKGFDGQRQSVQSDLGYGSRTSSPPLEASVDGVDFVGKQCKISDPGISPEDLEMVKKIHAQLFNQSAGWGAMGPL